MCESCMFAVIMDLDISYISSTQQMDVNKISFGSVTIPLDRTDLVQ